MRKNKSYFCLISSVGWFLFSLHWLSEIEEYVHTSDYTNIILVLAVALLCLMLSVLTLLHVKKANDSKSVDVYRNLLKMVLIVSVIYFPFNAIDPVKNRLIQIVAFHTHFLLQSFGYPAVLESWNMITYNYGSVYIVLACTAIESIALFTGIITATQAGARKKIFFAVLVSSVIYILNLLRNSFVIVAFGDLWFGENSFIIAHHYIAKAGSIIALILIAYFLFMYFPEILEFFGQVYNTIKEDVSGIVSQKSKS